MKREDQGRIRIAVQKSGRLSDKTQELLKRAGINFEWRQGRLDCRCTDFPLDLMLVRDDDIPEYVADGVCELGIVGENMLEERLQARGRNYRAPESGYLAKGESAAQIVARLQFGRCRLAIAVPEDAAIDGVQALAGKRIATSYPASLKSYLDGIGVQARIVEISGSVEVAPAMGIADAICDLVSTGATLESNRLRELDTVLRSEALLVRTSKALSPAKEEALRRLSTRIAGVIKADRAKYIMMNAPRGSVGAIRAIIPGMEEPTVVPLGDASERVAVHAVAAEPIFWETMERLKAVGASSILVVPIEKIIE